MDPWHSTPVKQNNGLTPEDARRVHRSEFDRTPVKHAVGQTRYLAQELSCHPILQDSNISVCEMDSATIQRQKREMQLLIAELKDRERELNTMAASHQRQLQVWEQDRQKVLMLEQRCARVDDEVIKRNEMIGVLTHRLQTMETTEKAVQQELMVARQMLHNLEQKQQHISQQCQDWEEKNRSLNSTVMSLSSQVGSLQAREEELSSMLKLKDSNVKEATAHILELTGRLRDMDTSVKESHSRENRLLKEVEEQKRRYREARHDNAFNKEELQQHIAQSSAQREEIIHLKQELQLLGRDLAISGEGETWKDELLVLARSKQERTESELHCLRQVCENQQNDLQLLRLNLEGAQHTLKERNSNGSLSREAAGSLASVDSLWNDNEQYPPWRVTGKGSGGPKENPSGHKESDGSVSGQSSSDTVTVSDPMEIYDFTPRQSSKEQPWSSREYIASPKNVSISQTLAKSSHNSQACEDRKDARHLSCKYMSIDPVTGKVNYHSSGYQSNTRPFVWNSTDTEVECMHNSTSIVGYVDRSDKAKGQAMPSLVKADNLGHSDITGEKAEDSHCKTTSYRCKGTIAEDILPELPEPRRTPPYSKGRSPQSCVERETLAPSSTKTREECSKGTDCGKPVCQSPGGDGNQDTCSATSGDPSHTDTALETGAGSNLVASLRVLLDIGPRSLQSHINTCQDQVKMGCLGDSSSSCRKSGHVIDVTSLLTTNQLVAASDDQGVSANSKDGSRSFSNCCLQRLLDDTREMTACLERTNIKPAVGSPQNSHTVIISQNTSLDRGTTESPFKHTCQSSPRCTKCLQATATQPTVSLITASKGQLDNQTFTRTDS